MDYAFVISEYKWKGHKHLIVEKLHGDGNNYRVTIVKRCSSLNAAKDIFLSEIPEGRRARYSQDIEDYALKNGIKLTQEQQKKKNRLALPPTPGKGQKNDKSKRKGA